MYQQNTKLFNLLQPIVQAMGYEMLGIEYYYKNALLRLYIDSGTGVTLEDCEKVNQQVIGILDVNNPIKGRYTLEVSSPGAERPLFTLEHIKRFVGELACIRLSTCIAGRRKITGRIISVDNDVVSLGGGDMEYQILADTIIQANLRDSSA